jgi:hypothetical protein
MDKEGKEERGAETDKGHDRTKKKMNIRRKNVSQETVRKGIN